MSDKRATQRVAARRSLEASHPQISRVKAAKVLMRNGGVFLKGCVLQMEWPSSSIASTFYVAE